jgi:polysaccharide export outer membrane protein
MLSSAKLILSIWFLLMPAAHGQQPVQSPAESPDPRAPVASPGGQAHSQPELQTRFSRYELRPGDVIEIIFRFVPELNQTIAVQPDGFVSLPEIGDIHVEGDTVGAFTQNLRNAYEKILQQPAVTVVLKEFEKPHFIVAGEVNRPGKYELRADTTTTEAVAIAGGFNGRAKHSQVLLFRRISADWVEVKKIDLKRLYAGDYREDIHLRAGDMLYVPQSTLSKIAPFMPRSSVGAYINPTDAF